MLGIDPGKLTGVVVCDTQGRQSFIGNLTVETLFEFLSMSLAQEINVIIMENFIVGSRAVKLKGSKNEASQVIGVVRTWANVNKIPIVLQPPEKKEIGMKWSKTVPVGAHNQNHWVDAFNHVFYWLVNNHYTTTTAAYERKASVESRYRDAQGT